MILRRTLIAAAPLALTACRKGAPEHFGNIKPPSRQRLVYLNRDEPFSLDPALVSTNKEINTTHTRKNGVTTIQTTGALKVRLTNTVSGKAIDRNISGPIHSTVNSDGSITQKGTGPALWVLDPEVAPGLPRLIISKGKTESVLGPQQGAFRFITPPQSSFENLCAALA